MQQHWVRTLAVDTTRWRAAAEEGHQGLLQPVLKELQPVGDQFWHCTERKQLFTFLRQARATLHTRLKRHFRAVDPEQREQLMLALGLDLRAGHDSFEVHALRFAEKIGPEGSGGFHVILSLLQQRRVKGPQAQGTDFIFSGGCTLIAELQTATPRYFISKNLLSESRLNRQADFQLRQATTLAGLYFGASPQWENGQRLALLHAFQETDNDGYA